MTRPAERLGIGQHASFATADQLNGGDHLLIMDCYGCLPTKPGNTTILSALSWFLPSHHRPPDPNAASPRTATELPRAKLRMRGTCGTRCGARRSSQIGRGLQTHGAAHPVSCGGAGLDPMLDVWTRFLGDPRSDERALGPARVRRC